MVRNPTENWNRVEEIYEDCGVCVYIRVHSAWVSVCRDRADDKSCPVHLDRLQVPAGCADPGRGIHLLRDHFWGRVFFFFDVTILEVFIELVTILLLFLVLVFGHEACGIFAPQPGIKPKPPALEGEVLTTGSSGKPSQYHF